MVQVALLVHQESINLTKANTPAGDVQQDTTNQNQVCFSPPVPISLAPSPAPSPPATASSPLAHLAAITSFYNKPFLMLFKIIMA